MHLAIDIGNSTLKFALFDKEQMVKRGTGLAEMQVALTEGSYPISKCLISSVANHTDVADLLKKLNIPFSIFSSATPLPIKNLYQTPETLGSDRLTLAVAAHHIYDGSPVLVIGAGTCITFDFIHDGSYYGGAIAPGITMRFKALNHFTARLPLIDWSGYRHEIFDSITGTDSEGSILSGVLNGTIQEVKGTIDEYRRRYSGLKVAVTGGDMDFLVKNLKNDIFARPDMVLEGLNYILLHDA